MPITAFPFRVDGDNDPASDYNMHSVAINALEAVASPLATVYNIRSQGLTGVNYSVDSATLARVLAILPIAGGRIVLPEGDYYFNGIVLDKERVLIELEPGALIHTSLPIQIKSHGSGIIGAYVYSDNTAAPELANISYEGAPAGKTPIIQVCPLGTGVRLYSVQLQGLNCTGNGIANVEGVWLGTMDISVAGSPYGTGMSFSTIRDVTVWGVEQGWTIGHFIQINDFHRLSATGNGIASSIGINISGTAANSLWFHNSLINGWDIGAVLGNEVAGYQPNSIHFDAPDFEGNTTNFYVNHGTTFSIKDGYHEPKAHFVRIGTPAGAHTPHGVEISGNYILHYDATVMVPFLGHAWDGLSIHDNVFVSEVVGGTAKYFNNAGNSGGALIRGGVWETNTFLDLGGTTLTVLDAITGFTRIENSDGFQTHKLRALGDGVNPGDIAVNNAANNASLHLIYNAGVLTLVDGSGNIATFAGKHLQSLGDGATGGDVGIYNFNNTASLHWLYNGGALWLFDGSSNPASITVSAVALPGGQLWTTHAGSPNGAITAPIGSLCTDSVNGDLYRKTTGAGNTGWVTP